MTTAVGVVAAQAPSDGTDSLSTRSTAMLDWIDAELDSEEVEEAALDRYQRVLEALIEDAERHKARATDALVGPQAELDALGPRPEDGEPAEAPTIAEQRDAIIERIRALEAQSKQTDLMVARAETQLDRLGAVRGERLLTRLVTRGPSLFSVAFWRTALADAARVGAGLADDARHVTQGRLRQASSGWLLIGLVVALALAVLPLRRWLSRRYGRHPTLSKPSYTQRTLSAFAEGVARGLLPAAIVGGVGAVLITRELVGEPAVALVTALTISVVLAVATAAPIDAALAPDRSDWRLLPIDSDAARRLTVRLRWLIGSCALMLTLYLATARFRPYGVELHSLGNLVLSGAIGLLLLSLLDRRLWRRSDAVAAEATAATPSARRRSYRLLSVLRRLLTGVLVAAIGLAVLGYVGLSSFVVSRVAISAVFVSALLLLRRLLRELLEQLLGVWRESSPLEDAAADDDTLRFWLHGLLDLLLAGPALIALSGFWGVPQTTLYLWSRRLLEGVTVGELTLSPGRVLLALVIFLAVLVVTRLLRRVVYDRVLPYTRLDLGLRHSVYAGIGYFGLTLAAVLAIVALGVGLSNLALILGALSVGIGLGLQGVVNNFMSGLVLLVQRPVRVGDWVQVGPHEGFIKDIKVISTEIETFDKASIIIPNADMVSNSLINWTHADRTVRIIIAVGVAYGSDTDRVRELLLSCATDHDDVLSTPEPYALFVDFGDSALLFELRVFVRDADRNVVVASELRSAIDRAFRGAGIVVPYPQRDVHVRDPNSDTRTPSGDGGGWRRSGPRPGRSPRSRDADGEAADGAD